MNNGRDCAHGRQVGKCDTCDLIKAEKEIDELKAQLEQLRETLPKELATAFAKGFVKGWEASNCGAIIDLDIYPLISGEEYAEGVINEQRNAERSA